MSVEIAWKQNILVTDFHLLKSLLVVLGFGSQAFVCGFSRQNINSALLLLDTKKTISYSLRQFPNFHFQFVSLNIYNHLVVLVSTKGHLISKAILKFSLEPKTDQKYFSISALVSKMGQIIKIMAHSHANE